METKLAINGGEPVVKGSLGKSWPIFDETEENALLETLIQLTSTKWAANVMKRFYLLFLILTVLLNCSLVKPKVIPDKNLAAAVREQLRLAPNEPISEKDLR